MDSDRDHRESWQGPSDGDANPARLRTVAAIVHELWCDRMRADGWRYHPKYSAGAKTHDALLPFDQLPPAVQKDVEEEVLNGGVLDQLAELDIHTRGVGAAVSPSMVRPGLRVRFAGEPPSPGVVIGYAVDAVHGWPTAVYVKWDDDGEESTHPIGSGELRLVEDP